MDGLGEAFFNLEENLIARSPNQSVELEDMDTEGDFHFQCPEYLFDEDVVQNQDESSESTTLASVSADAGSGSSQNADILQDENGSGSEDGDESVMNERMSVHPLLIPNVIEEVLKNLPAKDIETLRLVNRTWNSEACTVLRSKRVVVFVEPDAVRVYNNAMKNTTKFPHAQFEFCIPDITGFVDEDLREFWETFGPHIKCLEFRQTHLFWRDFLEVIENRVPNLEKLALKHLPRNVLHSAPVRTEEHQIRSVKILRIASLPSTLHSAADRLTNVLKAFPHLEVIEFLPVKQATVKARVSNALIEVLQQPDISLQNLRRIDNINFEVNSDALDAIANKRFPLQRLHITLANGVKASSFKNLITTLRPTLVELKVSFPDTYTNYQTFLHQNKSMHPEECVQFLFKLKSLKMFNFKGSINFVQNLLDLEHLEFTTSNLAGSIPFGFRQIGSSFPRFNQDHHLKGLKMISKSATSPNLAETLMLDSIARCFPYLNCLYIDGIDDDGLGVIYRNLPFLSEVELHHAKCTDQGLTGIPLEICNDMLETSTFIIVQAEKYRRDLFIGSLQFLRKLSIVAPKISDASLALGLVDCKNMRVLKFGSSLISDTGIIFVTDRFCRQLDLLDITECTEITEQSKFYAREKLTGKLKVSDASPDGAVPPKLTSIADVLVTFNPDRAIVIPKPKSQLSLSQTTSKFSAQDAEFFEEVSEEEMRERIVAGVPIMPPFQHNRFRIMRIRDALRRNAEFMRTLQRLGPQQFQRLFRAELQAGNNQRNVNNGGPPQIDPHVVDLAEDDPPPPPGPHDDNVGVRDPLYRNIEEDDGGPAAGDAVPNRLPEIHVAEIYRLGLRPEDIEFWLLNRPMFEREENGNGNVRNAAMRVMPGEPFANFFRDDLLGRADAVEDDIIDLDAFRQVVMNAFEEEPFAEG